MEPWGTEAWEAAAAAAAEVTADDTGVVEVTAEVTTVAGSGVAVVVGAEGNPAAGPGEDVAAAALAAFSLAGMENDRGVSRPLKKYNGYKTNTKTNTTKILNLKKN